MHSSKVLSREKVMVIPSLYLRAHFLRSHVKDVMMEVDGDFCVLILRFANRTKEIIEDNAYITTAIKRGVLFFSNKMKYVVVKRPYVRLCTYLLLKRVCSSFSYRICFIILSSSLRIFQYYSALNYPL